MISINVLVAKLPENSENMLFYLSKTHKYSNYYKVRLTKKKNMKKCLVIIRNADELMFEV